MRELVSQRAMIGAVLIALTFGMVIVLAMTTTNIYSAIVTVFAFVVGVGGTAWSVRRQTRQALQE